MVARQDPDTPRNAGSVVECCGVPDGTTPRGRRQQPVPHLRQEMYFTVKAILRTLVLPPAGPVLLALLGCWLWHTGRRFGRTLTVAGLLGLWLLCTPLCGEYLERLVEHYPALDPQQPLQAQAIVVIGGGTERVAAPEYRGPAADLVLLDRLTYTAFLSRRK